MIRIDGHVHGQCVTSDMMSFNQLPYRERREEQVALYFVGSFILRHSGVSQHSRQQFEIFTKSVSPDPRIRDRFTTVSPWGILRMYTDCSGCRTLTSQPPHTRGVACSKNGAINGAVLRPGR